MANIKSAIKRVQITRVRTVQNAAYKSMMKTSIRRFETSLKDNNVENAKVTLLKALRVIDKLAGKGIIHKNMAARKKSQLTRRYNQIAS
ncbi:MAG: 30S ribosomal protein S20 [Firmicutes bacterium HGW-Firmicutes-12]|jgi:small subunit ribosomal protein S20|nr:MAG: 30S ribosomal protein S20 [Firmicutes bacterium HGW-Firmicutes-12]